MSGTSTSPVGEVRLLGTNRAGLFKTLVVVGSNWKIHIFTSAEDVAAFAAAHGLRVIKRENENDEGDNGA